MKIKELRTLASDDLAQKERNLKKDLFDLRYQRKIGRVEKPSQFKQIKRTVARILTILNERAKENDRKS